MPASKYLPMLGICAGLASAACAQTVRYVWTNSPAPAAPFTNWTTAAHVLQDAVDAAAAGDLVLVTNGVYAEGGRTAPYMALANRVCITNAVVVRSVNGPSVTAIQGQGPSGYSAVRCAYLLDGAVLSGFRLENGATFDYLYPGDEDRSGGGGVVYRSLLTNCWVVSNEAAVFAGGIYGEQGTVTHCEFRGNSASDGGGAYLSGGILQDSAFSGNVASPGYGGGAYVVGDGLASNCAFTANNGYWGGGLMLENARVSGILAVSNMAAAGGGIASADAAISSVQLLHNTAYDRGGGAFIQFSRISDSVVSNNDLAWQEITNQTAYGAGIASTVSRIENCTIQNNRGFDEDDRGGGLACFPFGSGTSQVINCSIRGNSAGDGGGLFVLPSAVCALSATGTNACDVRGNAATNFGGGLCASTQAVLRAFGLIAVSANAAGNGGGLAVRAGALAALEDSGGAAPVVSGNSATNSGGGLFAAESATLVALRAVQFQNNSARGDGSFSGGGGLALYGGAALLGTNLVFSYNQCPRGFGGALLLHDSLAALFSTAPDRPALDAPRTQFLDNLATNQNGGAVYAYGSSFGIQNAAFFGNMALRGAAVHVDSGSTGRFGNVVFANNSATLAGGALRAYEAAASGAVCDLRHCSLYGNAPDGVGLGGAAAVSLANCIVVGNGATNLAPGCTAASCDVGGGYAGPGNVDVDPGFRDLPAFDLHLTAASAGVVDAGVDAGLATDAVLRHRPLGAGFDLGAYEYRPEYDDSDADGMPDAWESDHGLEPLNDADRLEPDDGDGVSNFDEYLADTDPQNSNEFFRLTDCAYNPARPDRGLFVGFTSSSNRLYSLYCAEALSNGCVWTAMPGKTDVQGVGSYDGFNDFDAPFDATARTYRVVVAPMPE